MCEYIRGGGDRETLLARFRDAASPGFDPDVDLQPHRARQPDDDADVGVAGDWRDVPRCDARAIRRDELAGRYRAFDTICSATQDRQDAVIRLLREERLDLMIVIGGYNSSNTCNLAHICADQVPTYHIAEPDCLVSPERFDTSRLERSAKRNRRGWLPTPDRSTCGLTSGASTPDNLVEQVVRRLETFANADPHA